ncbi:hypothetical protein Q604_UNBC09284G0001, partial [human gut metagenome]
SNELMKNHQESLENQRKATENQQQTIERVEQKLEALNSETKKDSYNLTKEDRELLTDIKKYQNILYKQHEKWLNDANVKIKHKIDIENSD